jgi:hypothetical protein
VAKEPTIHDLLEPGLDMKAYIPSISKLKIFWRFMSILKRFKTSFSGLNSKDSLTLGGHLKTGQ